MNPDLGRVVGNYLFIKRCILTSCWMLSRIFSMIFLGNLCGTEEECNEENQYYDTLL